MTSLTADSVNAVEMASPAFPPADGGSYLVMTDDAPAVGGAGRNGAGTRTQDGRAAKEKRNEAAEKDRIARGAGVQDQIGRGADVREQDLLNAPGPGPPGKPEQARVPERGAGSPESSRVPGWLQTGAAWSWRLLLVAAAIYLVARVLGILYIVVVPCVAALLLTASVQPLTGRLRRAGLPALARPGSPCSSPPSCSAAWSCWSPTG